MASSSFGFFEGSAGIRQAAHARRQRRRRERWSHLHPMVSPKPSQFDDEFVTEAVGPVSYGRRPNESHRMTIFSTALASASNSACEVEFGAYSHTVRPFDTHSATTRLAGPREAAPSFPSLRGRRKGRVRGSAPIKTFEGTKRIRGFLDRRSARAFKPWASAPFNGMRSSGDGPQGRSTRSATSAASYPISGKPGGVSIRTISTAFSALCALAGNASPSPPLTFSTQRESTPCPWGGPSR